MRLLLDTHTILWTLFKDEKLSEKARELIIDPENDVFVSIISYWEIAASTFHKLPRKPHKDPFDRMVVWQAIREDMTLVGTDAKLAETYAEYGLKLIW